MAEVIEGLVAEMQQMKTQMEHMQAAAQRMPTPADRGGPVPMANDSSQDDEADPPWSDIVRQKRWQAAREDAARFAKLLETAPDLRAL